jgi:flagellar protein FlbD
MLHAAGTHVCGGAMISVTRLKGQVVALNPDLIESVEENPDTTIRLISGEKLLVRESLVEVVQLVAEYRRYIVSALSVQPLTGGAVQAIPSQRPSQPVRG